MIGAVILRDAEDTALLHAALSGDDDERALMMHAAAEELVLRGDQDLDVRLAGPLLRRGGVGRVHGPERAEVVDHTAVGRPVALVPEPWPGRVALGDHYWVGGRASIVEELVS